MIVSRRWLVLVAIVLLLVLYALFYLLDQVDKEGPLQHQVSSTVWHWLRIGVLPLFLATGVGVFVCVPLSIFRIWRCWDAPGGATIMALLALIPCFTPPVLLYVLLRSHWEVKRIRRDALADVD